MKNIIQYTLAATLVAGAAATPQHQHQHHHARRHAGSKVLKREPEVVTEYVVAATETVYQLGNTVLDGDKAKEGLDGGKLIIVGESNPTYQPPPPAATTSVVSKAGLGAQFIESAAPTTTKIVLPAKISSSSTSVVLIETSTPVAPTTTSTSTPLPPATSTIAAVVSSAVHSKAASSSSSSGSSSGSSGSGQGIGSDFPSGKVKCSEFPSEYGALALDWLDLGGWSGLQFVPDYSPDSQSISDIITGVAGQTCSEGCMCSYACPAGYQKTQWPKAQGATKQSIGGLYCNSNGYLELTRSDSSSLCEPGAGGVTIQNDLEDLVATCRTDYPGTESMVIPAVANPGGKVAICNPDQEAYYIWDGSGTSAQYYINKKGYGSEDACVWNSSKDPKGAGNWSPLILGVGRAADGVTYISIFQNLPTSTAKLDFNVEITGDVTTECSYVDGAWSSGSGSGCTSCMVLLLPFMPHISSAASQYPVLRPGTCPVHPDPASILRTLQAGPNSTSPPALLRVADEPPVANHEAVRPRGGGLPASSPDQPSIVIDAPPPPLQPPTTKRISKSKALVRSLGRTSSDAHERELVMSLNRVASLETVVPAGFDHHRRDSSVARDRRGSDASVRVRRLTFNPLPQEWDSQSTSMEEPHAAETVGAYDVPPWKRQLQIAAAVLSCLFVAGIVFGYAALKPDVCVEIRLNLMFTVAAVGTNVAALPVGAILDTFGPRVCGVMSSVLLAAGALLMANFRTLPFDALLPGYLLLALGGPFTFISSFQLSNAFPRHSGFILALLTGAFDASSALFLVYRIIFNATAGAFDLHRFFIFFLAVPVAILVLQLTLMPSQSYKTMGELVDQVEAADAAYAALGDSQHSMEDQVDEHTALLREERREERERREAVVADVESLLGSDKGDQQVQAKERHAAASGVWGVMHDATVSQQMRSPWFWLICAFTIVQMTRINFFVATIRPQYEAILGSRDKAAQINSFFDIALPVGGLVSIPFIGMALDHISTILVLAILVSTGTLIGVLGVLPYMWAAYANIVLFVLYRPFYYTAVSDYSAKVFGFRTFGTVYGLIICLSGLFNLSQSGLDILFHETFGGNPVPVDLILLFAALLAGVSLISYVGVQLRRMRRKPDVLQSTYESFRD
ncbi:hypothetical protein G7046_g4554 [Stylonectria norvegica]|nr:hypothetical protein G7046_g4554 [Stylonectria norvegica]